LLKIYDMQIEVSNGEIADKLTIIEIKLERIKDSRKLANLQKEYDLINNAVASIIDKNHQFYQDLYNINNQLWDIEDHIRDLERAKDFGDDFVQTARSVYFINDKRSDVKRKINELTGSNLTEEKSYEQYQ
jgi:cupin superfamily acireductone dioxygenase involved in methionine salvage